MQTLGVITHEELAALNQKYREIKHDINNTVAVLMAMAEMSKLKPEYKEKLAETVIARSQQIVEKMQEFQKLMNEKLETTGAAKV